MPELTIVTVCIEKHYEYIRQQITLLDHLNPGVPWRMLIVDNSNEETPRFTIDDPRCKVIAGVAADMNLPSNCRGSYHHAAALNKAMLHAHTRYTLVLDPDLFVVYRNWISECLEHMERNELVFFGVPWHPRWYNKYRFFPCVHFALIDQSKLSATVIDFMPAILEEPQNISERAKKLYQRRGCKPQTLLQKLRRPIDEFLYFLTIRRRINCSLDTGWQLWHNFRQLRARSAIPVSSVPADLQKPSHLQHPLGARIERLFPARWSFLPQIGEYIEPKHAIGFKHKAYEKLMPEMFVWRGAPFAFHLRRFLRDFALKPLEREEEDACLEAIFNEVKHNISWTEWFKGKPLAANG